MKFNALNRKFLAAIELAKAIKTRSLTWSIWSSAFDRASHAPIRFAMPRLAN